MAIVKMMLKNSDRPSEEQLKKIAENANRTIVFDEESPEMTDEMLRKFKRANPHREVAQ